jgi:hypothetical protein
VSRGGKQGIFSPSPIFSEKNQYLEKKEILLPRIKVFKNIILLS